jgi:hypothetical protein
VCGIQSLTPRNKLQMGAESEQAFKPTDDVGRMGVLQSLWYPLSCSPRLTLDQARQVVFAVSEVHYSHRHGIC